MPVGQEPERLWTISSKVSWVHVTDLSHWTVIPYTPCSPHEAQLLHPGRLHPNVYLKDEIELPMQSNLARIPSLTTSTL